MFSQEKLMTTLYFPDDEFPRFFSCTKFECVLVSGERQLEGVVMDGTETGILAQLPQFHRYKYLVSNPGRSVPEHQY